MVNQGVLEIDCVATWNVSAQPLSNVGNGDMTSCRSFPGA